MIKKLILAILVVMAAGGMASGIVIETLATNDLFTYVIYVAAGLVIAFVLFRGELRGSSFTCSTPTHRSACSFAGAG